MKLKLFLALSCIITISPDLVTGGWRHISSWRKNNQECKPAEATVVSTKPSEPEDPSIIETQRGKVQGIEGASRSGKRFWQFLGIPYGKPPVGDLRFEPPQPAEKWAGIFNASSYGAHCAQYRIFEKKIMGQEDCLTINVLTPQERTSGKLLPVLAYIHGGAFFIGSASEMKGDYFMDHEVVFVSFNYRLGALGFINTNDGLIKGNMALKDQRLALQWIQDNIEQFGGDKKLVTISGLSAGSICANHHVISPKSAGLFSKAMLFSGTVISAWGICTHPEKNANRYIKKVKCDEGTKAEDKVSCLKKLDVKDILLGHDDVIFPAPLDIETYFLPTIESADDKDAFLVEHPDKILKSGGFNKVPILHGHAEYEMMMSTAALSGNEKELTEAKDSFNTWAPRVLHYENNDEISNKIKDFYYKGDTSAINDTNSVGAKQTTDLFSDRIFNFGHYKLTKYYSPHVPVFTYYHAWKPDTTIANIFSTTKQMWVGNSHGDDSALFGIGPFAQPPNPGHRLYNMSTEYVQLLVDFMNEEWMDFRSVPWWQNNPKQSKLTYLKIDESPEIVHGPFKERMKFWESIEDQIINP